MIETTTISTRPPAQESAARGRDDGAPAFSFSFAMSALETRASRALETHGATPDGDASPATASKHGEAPHRERNQSRGQNLDQAQRPEAATRNAQPQGTGAQSSVEAAQAPTPDVSAQKAAILTASAAVTPGATQTAQALNSAPRSDAPATRLIDAARADITKAPRTVAPQARPDAAGADFAKLLARRLDAGATQFEMRLDPPSLGRVEASLRVGPDGDNSLLLRFEQQTALDLFQRDEAALRAALSQSGFSFDGERVLFELRDDEAGPVSADAAEPDDAVAARAYADPWSAGVIDISI